jgi:hypothetical protein
MFWLVMPRQRFGDVFGAAGAAWIAKPCEVDRIPLAGHDRPNDCQACRARDIGQHLGQLDIHLLQGFLHVLHMRGAIVEQRGVMTQKARNAHISASGRKEPLSRPQVCQY